MKKYNTNSRFYADWTTKKLKDEAKSYYQAIYVNECYGMSDLRTYDGILRELDNRGVEGFTVLQFN